MNQLLEYCQPEHGGAELAAQIATTRERYERS